MNQFFFRSVNVGFDDTSSLYYIFITGDFNGVLKGILTDLCSIPQIAWSNSSSINNYCHGISTVFGNPQKIVTTNNNTIYHSEDYGLSWNQFILNNFSGYHFYDIACSNSYIYYAGYNILGQHCILRQDPSNNSFQITNFESTPKSQSFLSGSFNSGQNF